MLYLGNTHEGSTRAQRGLAHSKAGIGAGGGEERKEHYSRQKCEMSGIICIFAKYKNFRVIDKKFVFLQIDLVCKSAGNVRENV